MTNHIPSSSRQGRAIRNAARRNARVALVERLRARAPREVYAGLLWIAGVKGYKRGWIAWKFKELFGGWPRPSVPVTAARPLDTDLEEWVAMPRRRHAGEKA